MGRPPRSGFLMSKVLITGIAGFIGSHLADSLVGQGHQVVGIDNLSTGRKENLSALPEECFTFGDVKDINLLEKLVSGCDIIYHFAASVGVQLVCRHPAPALETNLSGTVNIFKTAAQYGKKVFLASSSEVYGKLDKRPLAEDDDLMLGPPTISRWGYGCSKLAGEYLGLGYYKETGLPVIIGRLFNVCGPGQTGCYGMVLPRFVDSALRGEPITVYGDGLQTRSFIHITDAVAMVMRLMAVPEAVGKVYNIGNPGQVTINRLAELVREKSGSRSVIINKSYHEVYGKDFEDMRCRVPDISRIKKVIDFVPRISVEETVSNVIDWWKDRIK